MVTGPLFLFDQTNGGDVHQAIKKKKKVVEGHKNAGRTY